ncbi:hypothetical protein [Aquimarina sediminis]|uniref:hypothetical protein n=1 Tax=Aquimarina sediminis TaxID=2070536 RepID=UPI000FFE82E8|nr:hypothetical protein [Aquimarina sediminis]
MKKTTLKMFSFIIAVTSMMTSCSSDDNPNGEILNPDKSNVALFVITDPNTSSGLLIPGEEMFSGSIDPSTVSNATQIASTRTTGNAFGNDVYHTSNSAGDQGIQKFSYENNSFSDKGFIAVTKNRFIYEIVNSTKGYYTDSDRSQTAIQTFNPTSMERTGEIDIASQISHLITDKVARTRIGAFMIESQGKLYTQVFFYDKDGKHVYDTTYVAVIDTSNDTFLNLASHNDFIWLGFERKNSNYVNKSKNGDIYLSGILGDITDEPHSKCIRIKAGSNDFDASWKLDFNDFIGKGSFSLGGPAIIGDQLYVRLKSSPMAPDYSNLADEDIEAYTIDINTKKFTKIEDIPRSGAIAFSINGPSIIGDLVYFAVSNTDYQGYYSYDPASGKAEEAFSLTGGIPSQLVSIQ